MKKAIALLLSLIMLISFASCKKQQEGSPSASISEEPNAAPTETLPPTEAPSPTPAPQTSSPVLPLHLKEGDRSEVVTEIQRRLMDLNYIDSDEPGEYYSSSTTEAVKRFQRRNGLAVTGMVEDGDYSILMSSRAKTYVPGPGDEGEDIGSLQERLHELGYLETVTGVFDEATGEAVRLFQDKNFLEIDGMLNAETVEYLYYDNAMPNSPDLGTSSEQILECQRVLYDLGYLFSEPTGLFDDETASAVRRFQGRNDLIVDGYLGPSTVEALLNGEAGFNTLEYTVSGDDVLSLQQRLAALNYLKTQEINGYFGMVTEEAVCWFQQNNGIEETGKVDRHTRDVLFSNRAKAAESPHTASPGQTLRPTPVPTNTPAPIDPITPGTSAQTRIRNLINIAAGKLNCPYVRGAGGPDQFDCSGFVYWCLNKAGVKVSYMSSYKWRTTNLFPRISSFSEVKAGDILVFKMDDYKGHVAIAIGNGLMIDASSTTGRVVCRSCNTSYWKRVFYCAYRIYGN